LERGRKAGGKRKGKEEGIGGRRRRVAGGGGRGKKWRKGRGKKGRREIRGVLRLRGGAANWDRTVEGEN